MQSHIDTLSAALPWFFPAVVFVVGALVGSFLNVCIIRLPLGESIVRPRSHCRACGAPIAWFENIPVLGWLILRGRARCCGARFSFRYAFVELLTAALFVACWVQFAHVSVAKALCGMVFVSALVCATFTDIDHLQIPDALTVGLAMLGLILSCAVPSLHGQTHDLPAFNALRSGLLALTGMLVGAGLLLWIALIAETLLRKEAMGFQDVTFLGAIGAFCGWQGAIVAIFGGAVLGMLWFALVFVFGKISRKKIVLKPLDPEDAPAELGLRSNVPFGPMLAAGALAYFLWLHAWIDPRFAEIARLIWS